MKVYMFFIGVDIGKNHHEATVLDSVGKPVGNSIRFNNDEEGFRQLWETIPAQPRQFAMEGTGHYWLNLYTFLVSKEEKVLVINPIQTEAFRRGQIRRTKTDRRDSWVIAELLRTNAVHASYVPEQRVQQIRDLTRFRFGLVDQVSDLKRQLLAVLDRVFPEFEKLFSDPFIRSARELLRTVPLPEEIVNFDLSELSTLLAEASRGRFKDTKAQEIKKVAGCSVGTRFSQDAARLQIRCLLEHIEFLEVQIADIEAQLEELVQNQDQYLCTIPGISTTTAAVLLGEIGDINRFEKVEQLAAYAGIDPTTVQSGEFTGTKNHMSKRGSPYLRRALWLAATPARKNDPGLQAFYEKKLAEGKHPSTVTGAICRRLLNRVFVILKEQRPYEKL
ncbi:Transposase IS116/IS110/IS902 family protein [Pelotomaculum sp. FP]|uniref:IS110 family transposase n=1 Tax=Pelotomaculum sp. FP TaxID=261474 RepID=UPI001065D6CC|nr:IS110 family transposase [Pelotomaculum sp. FP]TEB15653.1 Transposase IS116/IS110/IS902 family protein [Pelotomaculum sp. FP]